MYVLGSYTRIYIYISTNGTMYNATAQRAISGFRRDVDESCALLGHYGA